MRENHIVKCTCKLAQLLRDFAPVPGDDYRHLVVVELKPGETIKTHQHRHHTVVYYPVDASPITIQPRAGMLVYLPPDTPHNVPATAAPRVSLAMIIDD